MVKELRNLTNECLPYLIDKGVEILVSGSSAYVDSNYILLSKFNNLSWGEIKYDVIPLTTLLNSKYKLREVIQVRFSDSNIREKVQVIDINNDNIDDARYIEYIQIHIHI